MRYQSTKPLDAITWPEEGVTERAWKQRAYANLPNHNHYQIFGGVWQVKVFMGGAQRLFGESRFGYRAARFADMAIVHFLSYRKRKRELVDSDLNFSVAQAKQDLVDIPDATAILRNWEVALLSKNLICARTREAQVNDPNHIRKLLATHSAQLGAFFEQARTLLEKDELASGWLGDAAKHFEQSAVFVRSLDSALLRCAEVAALNPAPPDEVL